MGALRLKLIAITVASVGTGCSTTFTPQTCAVDGDCGAGLVCELRDSEPVCVHAEDAPLIIGQSAPVTGTNQALGTGMKLGIELAFSEANAAGGVRGRQVQLDFRDDAYQPDLAEEAARALVDAEDSPLAARCPSSTAMIAGNPPVSTTAIDRGPTAVLAFLGNVGTPTMVRAAPVAVESGTLFFGAFTGATTMLRDDTAGPCKKYIFNVRASYAEEAEATVEYFKNKGIVDYHTIFSFDQNDSFGQAGYDGLTAAYNKNYGGTSGTSIQRFRYARNDDTSVPTLITAAENYIMNTIGPGTGSDVHSFGVMMTDTYGAGAEFIAGLRQWQFAGSQTTYNQQNRVRFYFSNVSFVGPNDLSTRLVAAGNVQTPNGPMSMTDSVTVSQVVPNYQSDTSDVVVAYNKLIADSGSTPGFTSLEGYISARVFIAGLQQHQGPFTPDSLIQSFESLPDLSLGIGASSGFSSTNHQYSGSVWGTNLMADGTFQNLYFWAEGIPIQFYQ